MLSAPGTGESKAEGAAGNAAQIRDFYRVFVDESHDGKVLTLDLSQREDLGIRKDDHGDIILTTEEVNERADWQERKKRVLLHYHSKQNRLWLPLKLSQEEFLSLRVAAPCLLGNSRLVTARSALSDYRANRHYPQRIEAWDEFRRSVTNFRAGTRSIVPTETIVRVEGSLTDTGLCVSESDEEKYLADKVFVPLQEAGLLGNVIRGSRNCRGEPDLSITELEHETNVVVVGESKATHNLPLPMEAQEVARQYNDARAFVDQLSEPRRDCHQRTLGWSHVGHPVSQILGYMVLNRCRYGVLTSGSRTYWILMQRDTTNGEEKVFISDAWYTGQENYLRAWAFFYAHACDDTQPNVDTNELSQAWLKGTPDKVNNKPPSPSDQGTGKRRFPGFLGRGQRRGGGDSKSRSPCDGNIPSATLNDFEVGQPIGYGRRGTTFSGTWKGEVVALKLFDTNKNKGREAFEREIKAYGHLKEAWGRLVPTPKFIAEAFGVIFFGMQMAERPPQSARLEDWDAVLWELEETYGFRHLDVDGDDRGPNFRNHMMLRDDSGRAQPIVVDLEEYELLE